MIAVWKRVTSHPLDDFPILAYCLATQMLPPARRSLENVWLEVGEKMGHVLLVLAYVIN